MRELVALRIHLDEAVVAQDGVDAGAGGNRVDAQATEDDVVAVARGDAVVAAGGQFLVRGLVTQWQAGAGQRDAAAIDHRHVGDDAVVAQDDVVIGAADAEIHGVGAVTGQDYLGSGSAVDDVVAAQFGNEGRAGGGVERLGLDLGQLVADDIQLHETVVAKDDVGAIYRGDAVRTHAAEDGVDAAAHRDAVATARDLQRVVGLKAQRVAGIGQAKRNVGDGAVVADDVVVTRQQRDAVGTVAAQHRLVAAATDYGVVAAQVGDAAAGRSLGEGGDQGELEPRGINQDATVVADDAVGSTADVYRVGTHAAQDGVVALCSDQPVAAAGTGEGVGTEVFGHQAGRVEAQAPVVAKHDVVHAAAGNVIAVPAIAEHAASVGAAKHHVAAFAGEDQVVAADAQVDAIDGPHQMHQAVGLVTQAGIAEHLHRRYAIGSVIHDPAAIAEDDVVGATARDDVRALTAEDHQRQR